MDAVVDPEVAEKVVIAVERIVWRCPQPFDVLARRVRRVTRDARADDDTVARAVWASPNVVGRPDGTVCRFLDLLEGQVLTHRLRYATAGRTDLWASVGLMPLLAAADVAPLPLATGGELRRAEHEHPALVGPPGWLPEAQTGQLLGLRFVDGEIVVSMVDPADLPGNEKVSATRRLLSRHADEDQWSLLPRDLREGLALHRALGSALLEEPQLLSDPLPPMEEIVYLGAARDPSRSGSARSPPGRRAP